MGWYFDILDEEKLKNDILDMIKNRGSGYNISGITFDRSDRDISGIIIRFQKKTNASASNEFEDIGSIKFIINQDPESKNEPTDYIDAQFFSADGTNASVDINNDDEDLVQCYHGSMMVLPEPEYFKHKNNSGGSRKKKSKKSKKSRKTKKSRRTVRRR